MPIVAYFPTLIMHEYLHLHVNKHEEIKKRIFEIKEEYSDFHSHWACDTYTTANVTDLRHEMLFYPIIEEIKKLVYDMAKEYELDCNIKCTAAWANIANKGDYQEYHNHPNNHFSAVYYIKTPKDCGEIIFSKPFEMFVLPQSKGFNNSHRVQFTPEEGKVIIFPSSLLHMVLPNNSDEDRISMSMNFVLE